MSDFNFLENLAIKIQENRRKLKAIDASLADVNIRLHDIPLQRSTESMFAKMTGITYDDRFAELETVHKELNIQLKEVEQLIDKQTEDFLSTITSENMVIPLDTESALQDGKTIYKYRDEKKFENVFVILSELLGLSSPIVVKDVLLSPTEVVIAEKDEFDAKQKFITTFSEIQNTLLIKKRS